MSLARDLLVVARDRGATIATAESCTAGGLAAAITDPPGASDIYECGVVTYSNAAKRALLGVLDATLASHGAVSEPVAAEMAEGILGRSNAHVALSITGIAGPGGSEHKPEGRVCFAIALRGGETRTETVEFGAPGRAEVRAAATGHALQRLIDTISELPGASSSAP